MVFDSGDGVSHSVPVFDGHYLPHAIQRFPLAGVDVTMHLIKVFVQSHPSVYWTWITTSISLPVVIAVLTHFECADNWST